MNDDVTQDGVCRGFLTVWQPRRGYRFNLDSVLLAALASAEAPRGLVVDVGAGSGIIGLYVAKATGAHVLLVERQAAWIPLLRRNVVDNALPAHVLRADFRALPLAAGSVDLLLGNPPFTTPGTGRVSPNAHKHLSRHAEHGGAAEILVEAERVLTESGRALMVLPLAVAETLRSTSLHRARAIRLSAREGLPPDRVLVVYGRRAHPEQQETRAVHDAAGHFSSWVEDVLEGRTRALR